MKARRLHPYDGSNRAGKPVGPVLKVEYMKRHAPIDGPSTGIVVGLSDGGWEFLHNLEVRNVGYSESRSL